MSLRKKLLLSTGLTFGFAFGVKMFLTTAGLAGALSAAFYGLFFAGVASLAVLAMDRDGRNKLRECINTIKVFVVSLTPKKYTTLRIVDYSAYSRSYSQIFSETKTVVIPSPQSAEATIRQACQKYMSADISTLECERWYPYISLNLSCFTSNNSTHVETLKLTRFSFNDASRLVQRYFKNITALFLLNMDSDRFALHFWNHQTFNLKNTNITTLNVKGLQKYGRALEDYILPALQGSKVTTLSLNYSSRIDPWHFSFEESDTTSVNPSGHYFNSKKIIDALKKTDITTLELERHSITLKNGAPSLANELKETKLTTLNLRENNITFEDAKAFAKNLKGSKVAKLYLAGNHISAEQEKEIARILEKNCAKAVLNGTVNKKDKSLPLVWLAAKAVTSAEIDKAKGKGLIPAELETIIAAARFFRK